MEHRMPNDNVVKAADGTMVTAAGLAGVSWAAAADVIAVIAGIFAIIAACASAWFHIERAIVLREQRLERNNDDDS